MQMPYLYPHFQRSLLMEDMTFHGGVRPEQPFPDFELMTTDGGRVRKSDYLGRPLMVTFASFT